MSCSLQEKLTKDEAENLLKLKHKILSETAQNAQKAHALKSTTYTA